jgi:hypothetical protein
LKRLASTTLVVGLSTLVIACGAPGLANAPPPQARHFTIRVTGGHADVALLKAYQGDTVTITVYADRSEEIHLHGYDLRFHPRPDHPATLTFTANRTGMFEYEIEESSTHLGNLEIDPR